MVTARHTLGSSYSCQDYDTQRAGFERGLPLMSRSQQMTRSAPARDDIGATDSVRGLNPQLIRGGTTDGITPNRP